MKFKGKIKISGIYYTAILLLVPNCLSIIKIFMYHLLFLKSSTLQHFAVHLMNFISPKQYEKISKEINLSQTKLCFSFTIRFQLTIREYLIRTVVLESKKYRNNLINY